MNHKPILVISIFMAVIPAVGLAGWIPRESMENSEDETATATLTLLSVAPQEGEELSKGSKVVAQLAYTITGFKRGAFFIMAQVETDNPKMTTDGSFPSKGYPVLKTEAGEQKLTFPIRHVWDEPSVTRPFRIRFYLAQEMGGSPRQRRVLAKAGPVEYSAK